MCEIDLFCPHFQGNGNPLQCSCLENPRDRGAWWAAVHGVTESRTQLSGLAHTPAKAISESPSPLSTAAPSPGLAPLWTTCTKYCSLFHQKRMSVN